MKKRILKITFLILTFSMLCACGDSQTEKEAQNKQAEEEEKPTDPAEDGNVADNPVGNDVQEPGEEPATDPADQAQGEEPVQSGSGEEDSRDWDHPDLNGTIDRMTEDGFLIHPIETTESEDGSSIAVMEAEGHEGTHGSHNKVTISDSTKYQIRKVNDDRMTSTMEPAGEEDLEPDVMVDIWGSWQGEVFCADEIVIWSF